MRDEEKPFCVEKNVYNATKDNTAQKTRKTCDSDKGIENKIKVTIAPKGAVI